MAGHKALDAEGMRRALGMLDSELADKARLIIGGGAAMVLAYHHPFATQDVDAFAARGGLRIADLDAAARKIAKVLDIEPDWLNCHFDTFTVVLPADYATRLRPVFKGCQLTVDALGPEDLLVMKCFTDRNQDLPSTRDLLHLAGDLSVIERQLELLQERRYPGAQRAAEFFAGLRRTSRSVKLGHAPSQNELARLYFELAEIGATSVGERAPWPYQLADKEELIVLASQMMRYDARLLSILVQWLARYYEHLNPLQLRRALRPTRWPESLLVALDFARASSADPELAAFVRYVSTGFKRLDPAERFFFDSERPASRSAARNLGRNLAPYARWGFIGRERPTVDAVSKRTVGRYDAETRRRILEGLVERYSDFSIADYLSAVDGGISRQQALADLRACAGIKHVGKGRGARWRRANRRRGDDAAERRPGILKGQLRGDPATPSDSRHSPRNPVATTKIS